MRQIDIQAVPNQSFSATINGILWELTIKQANTTMFADITRDGEVLVQGQRIVADAPILPYRYLSMQGNFTIETQDDEYPNWERFGIDQFLYFLEPAEVGIND